MAILTPDQLQELRSSCAEDIQVRYDKALINGVMQVIEDTFDSLAVRSALSNAIDTASTPLVFTATEKRMLVKSWLRSRFRRGN